MCIRDRNDLNDVKANIKLYNKVIEAFYQSPDAQDVKETKAWLAYCDFEEIEKAYKDAKGVHDAANNADPDSHAKLTAFEEQKTKYNARLDAAPAAFEAMYKNALHTNKLMTDALKTQAKLEKEIKALDEKHKSAVKREKVVNEARGKNTPTSNGKNSSTANTQAPF